MVEFCIKEVKEKGKENIYLSPYGCDVKQTIEQVRTKDSYCTFIHTIWKWKNCIQ